MSRELEDFDFCRNYQYWYPQGQDGAHDLPRRKRKVMIPFGEVEVKICGSEGAEKCYPEYESLAEICRKTGISYAEAYQMAVDASKNLE